jgi:hypothetical protein
MIPIRAKRRDANEREIIEALKAAGCSVLQIDVIDLVVGRAGCNFLLEVKDGSLPPSRKRLTDSEANFIRSWRGREVVVVETVEEALRAVGAIK